MSGSSLIQNAVSKLRRLFSSNHVAKETATPGVPDDLDARVLRAQEAARQGRFDEAMATLKDVLARAPNHAEAHLELGEVYYALDRPEEAVTEFATALELAPGNHRAAQRLSLILPPVPGLSLDPHTGTLNISPVPRHLNYDDPEVLGAAMTAAILRQRPRSLAESLLRIEQDKGAAFTQLVRDRLFPWRAQRAAGQHSIKAE